VPGTRRSEPRPQLRQYIEASLKQEPFALDEAQRAIVLEAIENVCRFKHWQLRAAHVRSNHVHTVVDADVAPELAMNAFKAYASRALNLAHPQEQGRLRWARHGSTVYLWSSEKVNAAINYVLGKQGEPMACYRSSAKRSRHA
jgi:REP element-mobilizing transposase RayT